MDYSKWKSAETSKGIKKGCGMVQKNLKECTFCTF